MSTERESWYEHDDSSCFENVTRGKSGLPCLLNFSKNTSGGKHAKVENSVLFASFQGAQISTSPGRADLSAGIARDTTSVERTTFAVNVTLESQVSCITWSKLYPETKNFISRQ